MKMAEAEDIAAPFDPAVLALAERTAAEYDIVLRREDDEWYGHALEYPEAMGDGRTPAGCVRATRRALVAALATMIEAGEAPPPPARQAVRCEQVNVRLTQEEKALLETSARRKGFRGVSDFIRAAALASTR